MNTRILQNSLFLIVAGLVSFPALAASASGGGVLNDVTLRFYTYSSAWSTVITGYATWLFWTLVTISMVWTFGMMALRKADVGELFAEFVKFTITTGFFWWLLSDGPAMAVAIISSMQEIGARAAGSPVGVESLTPSSPVSIGLNIVKKAFASLSWVHPIDNLAVVIVSTIILLCMCIVAANILIALVNAWVMAYAGIFILGFGGARWTSDMAIGYFKSMLGVGMELMTITLLVGIATSVINGFYTSLDGSSLYELLVVFCVCAVLALLIHKIPGRMAALAGGGSGTGFGVGTLMGGMAMAASAAATGGAAAVAGAANVGGGAQALMAAFSRASAAENSGGGGMGALMSAVSGAAGDSGGNSGISLAAAMGDSGSGASSSSGWGSGSTSSGNSGTSPQSASSERGTIGGLNAKGSIARHTSPNGVETGATMAAVGTMVAKVGKITGGTAANLAQGAWDVTKAKASDMRESAMERIGETLGGKIAAAINAREQVGPAGVAAQFNENSLSTGLKSGDMDSESAAEIAEFVNRPASTDAGTTMSEDKGGKARRSSGITSGKSVFE